METQKARLARASAYGTWVLHAAFQIQALKVTLQADNFLPQDERLQEFRGKYFRGHIKNSGSDALSITP